MDRDAGKSDRGDEARQGDAGMIGSEAEEPGPGRDTSLTDPDPVAASTDQPRGTVAMSEGDPMRTRLGSQIEGAGAIGHDVAAAEEGATQETPPGDRPGYEPERPGDAAVAAATAGASVVGEPDPLAAQPAGDQASYEREPGDVGGEPVFDRAPDERTADPGVGVAAAGIGTAGGVTGVTATGPGVASAGDRVEDTGPTSGSSELGGEPAGTGRSAFATEDAGPADRSTVADDPARFGAGDAAAGYEGEPGGAGMAGFEGEPGREVPATYTGEEADVTGRPEYADRAEGGNQDLYQQEPQRADRPGGGGSLFTDDAPERLDRPGPQEPGVQEGVYDQEADRARDQRPSGS